MQQIHSFRRNNDVVPNIPTFKKNVLIFGVILVATEDNLSTKILEIILYLTLAKPIGQKSESIET